MDDEVNEKMEEKEAPPSLPHESRQTRVSAIFPPKATSW